MSEVGTQKLKSELLHDFRSGQGPNSISTEHMRNLTESAVIPGMEDGVVNVETGEEWAGWTKADNYFVAAGVKIDGGSPFEETHPGILGEAITGEMNVPADADYGGASVGVAGRARTASLTHGAVGLYGSGIPVTGAGEDTAVWGLNTLCNNQGMRIGAVYGIEIDLNIDGIDEDHAPQYAIGCVITGSSVTEPTEGSVAFLVWPLSGPPGFESGTPTRFTNAFESISGAAEIGIKLWPKSSATNETSQEIQLLSALAGVAKTARIYAVSNGDIQFFSGGSAGPGVTVNAAGQVDAQAGFRTNGTAGLTGPVVVKGSDGNNCTLTFTGGILTGNTCP